MSFPTGTMGALFIAFSALSLLAMINNLVASFCEKHRWRRISKPFCLLFLGLAVAMAVPDYPMVYLAAFAGCLGDFLLLWKKKKAFLCLGLICFLLGHGLYIASILKILFDGGTFASIQYVWLYIILFVLVLMELTIYPISRLTNHSKIFAPAGVFYSTTLLSVGAAAILGCVLGFAQYLFLVVIGDAFFIISDSFLTYTLFIKDVKKRDFYVMVTYLLGQLFILSGLVLTLIK